MPGESRNLIQPPPPDHPYGDSGREDAAMVDNDLVKISRRAPNVGKCDINSTPIEPIFCLNFLAIHVAAHGNLLRLLQHESKTGIPKQRQFVLFAIAGYLEQHGVLWLDPQLQALTQ